METENQRLPGALPAMRFEAARVRRVDGQEVPDYPQPFNLLADAEKYVADTPVSIDGTRPWIRNATPSRISSSFLMVGGRWLQLEPPGVFKRVLDETPMQNAMRGLERAFGAQHPQFDRADHRREVDCGDTRLFDYWEWVVHQLEADETSVDDVIAAQDGLKMVMGRLPDDESAENEIWTNYYLCPCGEEWSDEWSSCCNDRCPKCNKEIEPYNSDDGSLSEEGIEMARQAAIANQAMKRRSSVTPD